MYPPSGQDKNQAAGPLVPIPKCPYVKARFSPNNYGPIVSVTVGKAEMQFHIHRGLLTYYSSYFKATLSQNWKEGKENAIKLPDDNPEAFKVFFHWVDTGCLYGALGPNGKIPLGYQLICETYVFADARIIPQLCNACIDALWQTICQEWTFPTPQLQYIYDNTTSQSNLRKFIVYDAAKTFKWENLDSDRQKYPQDFLADVILKLYGTKSAPGGMGRGAFSKETRLCEFHDHTHPTKELQHRQSVQKPSTTQEVTGSRL
ncbi:uncharacterized protein EI97DRAFT_466515 [Westerdykella ornata]|uniref:BTB domain-containing protein n=1 Tax=Westerdykella ornata TaxID=318751 RepID=A0A6A6JLF5_WESOR|nr:uncharacterized protein EI97DRAFT_466515 [Westerdykella ornata]KAF2276943.1 hypothetical protein EI97DRAFT_466515 [Westerdykella ornata]